MTSYGSWLILNVLWKRYNLGQCGDLKDSTQQGRHNAIRATVLALVIAELVVEYRIRRPSFPHV